MCLYFQEKITKCQSSLLKYFKKLYIINILQIIKFFIN
jgi:hypothetical protein